jgi:hypothetical protein
MRVYVWLILVLLFASVVYAGVLTVDKTVGPGGTTFTIFWRQGCSTGSLGPNQCYSIQPFHCPISSTGDTSLVANCSSCDCPQHSNCSTAGTVCDPCVYPCDLCPSGTYCANDPILTDWCTTEPDCQPIPAVEPVFIGYVPIAGVSGTNPTCGTKRGRFIYGTPNGDGTFSDCYVPTSRPCPSGYEMLRHDDSITIGYTDILCISGTYSDIRYSIIDSRTCRCDSSCTSCNGGTPINEGPCDHLCGDPGCSNNWDCVQCCLAMGESESHCFGLCCTAYC